jgi:ABC-type lipoprotein export system ATPase subunit
MDERATRPQGERDVFGAVGLKQDTSEKPLAGNPILSLRKVAKTYRVGRQNPVEAVRGVSLELMPAEFVIVTGRSGSGKTTLLNLAGGLARPSSGEVFLNGENLSNMPDPAQSLRRNLTIGFIFQFPSLVPTLTALENVILPSSFGAPAGRSGVLERGKTLLEAVGLTDKQASYPRQLSKGQQQRVVVARSLINNPRLLLADEATSDLDEETEFEIMELLKRVHAHTGITILMVTHASQLVSYSTRSLVMANGLLVDEPSRRLVAGRELPG